MTLLYILIFILVSLFIYINISPNPIARFVKGILKGGMAVTVEDYPSLKEKTVFYRDIDYGSKYPSGQLDIIRARGNRNEKPIFWIHGGAYVAGDKSDIEEYGVKLANEGFVFININYALAPKYKYPIALVQLMEAYSYIEKNKDKYAIDMEGVYFAGDSAGAQIVAQFVNLQVNEAYRERLGFQKLVAKESIEGVLLFCGPYNLERLKEVRNPFFKIINRSLGWAYLGERDWLSQTYVEDLSVIKNVNKDFPRTFITDGNFLSFEDHGLDLVKKLDSLGVEVSASFFKDRGELIHNYQFMMDLEESQETYGKLKKFLISSKSDGP